MHNISDGTRFTNTKTDVKSVLVDLHEIKAQERNFSPIRPSNGS